MPKPEIVNVRSPAGVCKVTLSPSCTPKAVTELGVSITSSSFAGNVPSTIPFEI